MNNTQQQIVLNIQGMSCGSCVRHVEGALKSVAGVTYVAVDLKAGRVEVRGTGLVTGKLLTAIEEAGYGAEEANQG
jgi:copper chaperone